MSFSDEYLKLRRKRKEEEAKKASEVKGEFNYSKTDIAPVGGNTDIAPVADSNKGGYKFTEADKGKTFLEIHNEQKAAKKSTTEAAEEKEKDERSWFQKGAFEDGYQFGDVSKSLAATGQDLRASIMGGILDIGEGVVDAGASLVAGIGGLFSKDFKEDVTGFIEKDLYDGREVAKKIVRATDVSSLYTEPDIDNETLFGEKTQGVAASGGQLIGQVALQSVGVPWFVTSGVTSYGGEVENALNQDATLGEAAASGLITAGAEILTEKISGGISFGGGTLDDALTKELSTQISNKFVRNAVKLGIDVLGEGTEEVLSEEISRFGQWLTYQDEKTLEEMLYSEEAMDAYIEAFIGGGVLGGAGSGGRVVNSFVTGRDATSGLTANEEKVFKQVYEERLAEEAEAKGEELTTKEQNKIYDETLEDLQKGRISTDTIESVLGGDSYKAYKDTVDSENTLREQQEKMQAEFDALQKMKQSDMTGEQMDRRTELRKALMKIDTQIKQTERNSQRDMLKNKLGKEVSLLTEKDAYLSESYAEKGRRSEKFTADTSKYKGAQAEVVQKAIDSGILNNTRRTHEFVDLVSKISADKGVLFDFTNNQKLKESGFAVDGATINGFVNKDGITLNMDSHKAWQSTVGHEITHVLENTEFYGKLQEAIKSYAESKGEYQSKYDAIKALYEGKDADIDAEFTSEMVGEYLFTDEAFVQNLSAKNRNVFQKIYDELKYLLKVATADSKEARELEKVKRAFDKAYKADSKTAGGTKYSLSDSDGKQLTKEQGEYFKDSKMRDDNGNLKVMYHGSQDAGFHVFDPAHSDDGTSLFFVDRNDVAASYSGTTETYEAQSIRTAEDMNKFIQSIGAEGYEVVENGGKFTLLYEGDRVADSNTAKGIYEEFCWYEGVGEGDANYKVYLNLTNPMEIDAKGRPWNKIDAEFSQEVYDKFNSLTAEEKAALVDLAEWEDFRLFNSEIQEARDNAVASAYAKLGDDANIYDIFSVAADNFSEEAMRENSRRYLKTRDYAERAKAEGYDGVIIKNVHDNGGYSNGSEGASTVAIAFDSNQVKSVANESPTANADIRYSLSEDSEGRELPNAVKNRFANSKAVDENGALKVLYHGTASGEFSIFDKAKGSVEGDFGSGFYFTDNEADVSSNYEGGGPDFDNKVARRAEQIQFEEEIGYDEAEQMALDELYKGSHKFEVYLNIQNPATVGETMLLESDSYYSEYNQDDYDNEDDYYGDVEQLIADDIDNILRDVEWNTDVNDTEGLAEVLWTAVNDGGIGIAELKEKINNLYLEDSDGNLVGNEVTRQIIESLGYDGIIDPTVSTKFKNMGLSPDTTHYIVFKPNQIKDVDNQNPTDDPDIHRSLTKEGETPQKKGYATPLSDLRLQEDIAPVADAPVENVAETTAETYAPQAEPTLYELENELNAIQKQAQEAYTAEDMETLNKLAPKFQEVKAKIQQIQQDEAERTRSLDDADAPPEVDAPYYGESVDATPADPFDNRDIKAVGNRKVNAYMYENPEVKPFFQEEANIMLGDLENSTKGERFYTPVEGGVPGTYGAESYGVWSGTTRQTTQDIAYLLDELGYSYADIKKGLNAIIEDNGKENNACSKRIEFILNDRLMYGYQDIYGYDIPANEEYKNLVTEKAISEYNEEAKAKLFENADVYAPADNIAPVAETPKKAAASVESVAADVAPAPAENKDKTGQNKGKTIASEEKIAEVLTEEEAGKRKKRGILSMFKNSFLDKGMVFEDLSLKTGNRELQAKYNSMRYAEGMAQTLMKDGDAEAGVDSLKNIKAEVEATGKTKEFSEYLYHLHNVDRMSLESKAAATIQGLRQKFGHLKPEQVRAIAAKEITEKTTERTANTIKEAREYLNAAEAKNKPVFGDSVTADVSRETAARLEQENPSFKGIAEKVYGYMNYLRASLVEGGVISQETADLWAETYPHYVPIRRAGKDGAAINVPLDTGRTGINAPIKRATGGNSDILPLLDTMAMRTEQTFKAVTRNRFGVELKNTLGVTTANEQMTIDDVIDSIDMQDGLLQEGKNGANPTFTVFENGERVTFDITEEMYDALKPASGLSTVTIKPVRFLSEAFRGLLTEYNLVFAATNAVKDVQDVLFNSQHATATYKAIPRAIAQMATKGKYYKEYLKNGGAQNTYFDSDSKTFKEADGGLKKLIGLPFRTVSALNNTIERLPRLAEYIASREAGRSIDVAMLDAARVTTNFAAGGDVTKALNRNGFTFLNASVQGAMQQVRNVREAKEAGFKGWAQLAAKTMLAGLPAMLLNGLLWEDDEEYEELSDYVKDNYYIVAKYGDGQFVRIPKGRMVAVVQDAFEQIGNAITGDDEVDLANFLDLVMTNVAPNNPIENNILAPFMQVKNNETWYGEDLVPQRLQDLPAAEQYDESTDSISKWLAETPIGQKFEWSPYKINYLLNQYTGGVGDVFLPMLTPEAERGDDSMLGNLIAPWKDKFTTDSVMNNQNVSDFYSTMDELTANAKSIHATDEDVLAYKHLNTVNAELSELYKQKREIQNGSLTDSEKYEAVREVQEQINAIARESLGTYGNVKMDGEYASVGNVHFHKNDKGEWVKVSDKQLEQQEEVTGGLGIDPSEYWSNKSEYDFAYEYPEKYAVAKSIGGYEAYKQYSSELYDIKADKDESGKSITGSRKEKVIEYVNNLDIDYGMRLIIFKSEYNADDTYNYEIIDYLNNRDDISYSDMETILKELGFEVDSKGNIYW